MARTTISRKHVINDLREMFNLPAAAKDLLDEEHAVSVADKVKNLVDGLDLGKRKDNRRKA